MSNDIELNPGPSNDSTKFLCCTCDRSVTWDQKGIVCETCDQWFQTNCQNIHSLSYDNLNDSMVRWHCIICNHPNYSTIPLDLHSISTSNTFEIDPNFNYDDHSIISITSTSSSVKPVHASTPINKRNAHSKSNIPLRVLNINFQSIKRKQHIVNNIIESSKPDIVIDTETWLKPNIHNNEVFPENYNIYRKD